MYFPVAASDNTRSKKKNCELFFAGLVTMDVN